MCDYILKVYLYRARLNRFVLKFEKMKNLKTVFRITLGVFMVFAAIGHFTFQREVFQAQVPNWIGIKPDIVVIVSGVFELILGLGMIIKNRNQHVFGLALAIFFVIIFPGNIAQYVNGIDAFGLETDNARLIRLFFQPVLIIWALWSSDVFLKYQKNKKLRYELENKSLYDFKANNIKGETIDLEQYKGKTLLIVNTATACGLAGQFKSLEALYQKHKHEGFEILGFPSAQFLNQEPLAGEELASACEINFGVSFPLFEKFFTYL